MEQQTTMQAPPLDMAKPLEAARQGDRASFRSFIDHSLPVIFAAVWAEVPHPQAARMVTQEAIVATYQKLWTAQPGEWEAWLIDAVRDFLVERMPHLPPDAVRPRAGDFPQPLASLMQLPPEWRELVALHTLARMPIQKICDQVPKGRDIHRALAQLAEVDDADDTSCYSRHGIAHLLDTGAADRILARRRVHLSKCEACQATAAALQTLLPEIRSQLESIAPTNAEIGDAVAALPEEPPAPPDIPKHVTLMSYIWMGAIIAIMLALIIRLLGG